MEMNTPLTPLKRLFSLLQLDKKDIYYVYVYAIFAGLISLSLPLGIQAIIGLIAGGAISASLVLLVVAVTAATAMSGILVMMQLSVTEAIQQRIFARSAFEFAYRIPRLKQDAVTKYYAPELVNRFFDTQNVQKGIPKLVTDFSTAFINILFGLILIAFYHPFFAFFGLALMIIIFIIFRITGPTGMATSLKESKYKYEVAHWLQELARTMNTFKLWGNTQISLRQTDYLVCNYLDSRRKHFRTLLTQYGVIITFKVIVTASLLLLGSYLVIDNQINIGQFVAAEIVVISIITSVEKLMLSMDTVYDTLTALEKMGNVTDLPIEGEDGLPFESVDSGKGMSVAVEDLYFKFEDAERPTIDHLSMHIKPGERVCVAGYNSSGKSTLGQILAGLYSEFNGSVNYNGIPARSIELASLRRAIGDLSSQEDLFKGTILDNISLGNPEISLEEIVKASEKLGLSKFIQRLPNGYQTMLQPGGKNIPHSIRTKIMIARSIVKRPRLQVMEGFWNYLEPQDRLVITDFLIEKENNWTLIMISDDAAIAAKCDRTIIMQAGQIIEDGTYDQIRQSPHFYRVFKGAFVEMGQNGTADLIKTVE